MVFLPYRNPRPEGDRPRATECARAQPIYDAIGICTRHDTGPGLRLWTCNFKGGKKRVGGPMCPDVHRTDLADAGPTLTVAAAAAARRPATKHKTEAIPY